MKLSDFPQHDFDSGIIYNGDCLEIMPLLEGNLDAIISDPPYGITACHWDSVIPFDLMWENYNRLIKKNGAVVLFGTEPFSSKLRLSNLKNYKYDWVYEKSHAVGFLNANKMPMKSHENVLIFYDKLPTYNPQFEKKPTKNIRKPSEINNRQTDNYGSFKNGNHRTVNDNISYPKDIIKFNFCKNGIIHPTQKPVKLLEYLILTYTNEGDTILDNTLGSGTAAVAAHNLKRKWIGIEKDKEIYKTAVERIKRDTAQLTLF